MEKRIHDLVINDVVNFSGCKWRVIENARPSRAHDVETGVPSVAVAKAVCIKCLKGVRGHFNEGYVWTFQGNLKAGLVTVNLD